MSTNECWMLRSVVEMLAQECDGGRNGARPKRLVAYKNALLESFCLHLRNVLDFLYLREKSKPDDIIAADFFNSASDWSPSSPLNVSDLKGRINKEISHLTSRRYLDGESKEWKFVEIFNQVDSVIQEFRHAVPLQNLADEWKLNERPAGILELANNLTASSGVYGGIGGSHSGATSVDGRYFK